MVAQEPVARIAGTVRDATTSAPVAGAVVSLLNDDRAVLRRLVTGATGQFRLERAATGTRIQVLRLGYRPREVPVPSLDSAVTVTIERLPNLLDGVRVVARASCPARADAPAAFGLWEQARTALLSSVVTRDTRAAYMRRYRYVRALDSARVARMTVETDTTRAAVTSFSAALTPADFVRNGFVNDSAGERIYYGPDADVLLSDAFLDGYCLRLADVDRHHPERVGVRFTPSRHQRDRTEIDGALWIDTSARTLSHISYDYLVTDGRLRAMRPGGEVVFDEMPNGTVLIDRWSMRLAGFVEESIPGARGVGARLSRGMVVTPQAGAVRLLTVMSETGGAMAEARWLDDATWRGVFGALTLGVRRDASASATSASDGGASDTVHPLAGRTVRLVHTPYSAQLDRTGVAQFDELLPGSYNASLEDARLRAIHLTLSVRVPGDVERGATRSATVLLPTAESFVVEHCKRSKQWREGNLPLVLARVLANGVHPVRDTRVTMAYESAAGGWQQSTREFTTGADGVATLCAGAASWGQRVRVIARTADGAVSERVVTLQPTLQVVPMTVPPP